MSTERHTTNVRARAARALSLRQEGEEFHTEADYTEGMELVGRELYADEVIRRSRRMSGPKRDTYFKEMCNPAALDVAGKDVAQMAWDILRVQRVAA